MLDVAVSVLRLSEEEPSAPVAEQQAIEALVDAATEEGIIEQDEARLIEQLGAEQRKMMIEAMRDFGR